MNVIAKVDQDNLVKSIFISCSESESELDLYLSDLILFLRRYDKNVAQKVDLDYEEVI